MGNNPFDRRHGQDSSSSQPSHLSPDTPTRSASTRSRSPSGFSLRRSLSGRSSQEPGENRQPRSSFFGGMFSSSSRPTAAARAESPPPPYSENASGSSAASSRSQPLSSPVLPPAPPSTFPYSPDTVGSVSNPTANLNTGTTTPTPTAADDDQYAFLAEFNTIFLIDDSASMATENRWAETRRAVSSLLPVCVARDRDGVDVYFLNHTTPDRGDPARGACGGGYRNVTSAAAVDALFATAVRPRSATPTGLRLDRILRAYLRAYEEGVRRGAGAGAGAGAGGGEDGAYCLPPINIIVVTDGEATDEPGEVIAQAARRLDALSAPPHQIGIQFFQVGRDPHATRALQELDDELCRREGIRDMVDTATFNGASKRDLPTLTADGILKVVLGAVKRKLDRKVMVRVDGGSGGSGSGSGGRGARR
ncbi:uncharacterized protein GGS25DRAFT_519543 [Hypoxylon fragiforme]|uniref:uncharacterized protein n=1 Tax=Hypoxylon fragiforme TaxID=63214 RepID=UPI0020C6CBA1|nr:uncharacterized protein GGS25DRAFT_519543 [Hypoxylon fragiforme]KAI2611244.1 hypothetical protein GGS25DRAFT_519543 [Hypoxylon fragiforme]